MAYGTLQELKQKTARRFKEVEAGDVTWRIQSLTAAEWVEFSSRKNGTAVDILAYCLVNENAERLIADNDLKWLEELDSDVSHPLTEACWEHAAISSMAVQEEAKNSVATGSPTSA